MRVGVVAMLLLLPFNEEASLVRGHRAATICFAISAASSGVESFSLFVESFIFLVRSVGLSSAIS